MQLSLTGGLRVWGTGPAHSLDSGEEQNLEMYDSKERKNVWGWDVGKAEAPGAV